MHEWKKVKHNAIVITYICNKDVVTIMVTVTIQILIVIMYMITHVIYMWITHLQNILDSYMRYQNYWL